MVVPQLSSPCRHGRLLAAGNDNGYGGAFAVLFFVGYGKAFGPKHLGRIQGIAQAFGVVASALGPKVLAETQIATGSYWLAFQVFGFVAIVFAVLAWLTPMGQRQETAV